MLFYAVCHERPAKCSTNWEDSVLKPLADDSTVKLISYSHKTFKRSEISEPQFRLGKKIVYPRVVYNVCVSSRSPI